MTRWLKPGERFSHERMLDREGEREDPATWSARSPGGMVVTSHYLATAAGALMLAEGGDAVDAAAAASLALGVVEPASSGLGGMAMALVHRAATGQTRAWPGPCRAPHDATPEAVAASGRYRGYRAIAIPAHPSVLETLHGSFGKLPLETVFQPAIRYAEEGYPLTPLQERLIRRYLRPLRGHTAGSIFLTGGGQPLAAGTLLRQPMLARTLRRLAACGFRDFYEGEVARSVVSDMDAMGGFVRARDLTGFPPPMPVYPLTTSFGDLKVQTLPPPGGGAALVQMLNMFEAVAKADFDADTPEGTVLLAELICQARRDRIRFRLKAGAETLGGASRLVDWEWASKQADRLSEAWSRTNTGNGETSHLSVADRHGNIVAITQSIERNFGAAEVSPSTGILYNGFLRGFKVRNNRHPHFLSSGGAARSNACPTVLLRGDQAWGAIGSTGSDRLASGVFQVLVRLRREAPFGAVLAPRVHASPDRLLIYEDRLPPNVLAALEGRSFRLKAYSPYSFRFGGLNLIARDGDSFVGVAEPRRDGTAAGPEEAGDGTC